MLQSRNKLLRFDLVCYLIHKLDAKEGMVLRFRNIDASMHPAFRKRRGPLRTDAGTAPLGRKAPGPGGATRGRPAPAGNRAASPALDRAHGACMSRDTFIHAPAAGTRRRE